MDASSTPAWYLVVSTLAGVAMAAISSLINTRISKQSEEKKHFRSLVVNAAIEDWHARAKVAFEQRRGDGLYPLELHIMYQVKVCDVLLNPKMTEADVVKAITDAKRLVQVAAGQRLPEN